MLLGLINSAWVQANQPTVYGLQKTKELGFDSVDIFTDPLDIDIKERRLIKDECDRLALPIVSIALILALIIAVAAFNIVSAMVMVVSEKQSDIAILRTLGATPASIMKIFMVQGAWIGVIGTILGLAGGILLALNVDRVVKFVEKIFSTRILSPEIYFISDFPSEIQTADVMVVAVVSFAMALLATLYPSYRASRTKPAEALRYE